MKNDIENVFMDFTTHHEAISVEFWEVLVKFFIILFSTGIGVISGGNFFILLFL